MDFPLLLTQEKASSGLFLPLPGTINSCSVDNKCQSSYWICLSPRGQHFLSSPLVVFPVGVSHTDG